MIRLLNMIASRIGKEAVKSSIRVKKGRQLLVLMAALEAYPEYIYGYELAKKTKILAHNLYPILVRLENEGYLFSEMQDSNLGAPRRAYRIKEEDHARVQREVNSLNMNEEQKKRSFSLSRRRLAKQ
jgi:DNA-binding PadR family transcriptional regulator